MTLALAPLVFAALTLPRPALVITGTASCPTATAIDAQLESINGTGSDTIETTATGALTAQLDPSGALVHLKLLGADGRVLAERDLPPGACDELARAAALLITAWRTEFHLTEPRFALRRPPPPAKPVAAPSAIDFDIGGALAASLAGTQFTADGELAAFVGRHGARVLGRAALTAGGLRSIDVGVSAAGHARFLRAGLSLGPDARFRPGRWLLNLFAEATVALIYVDAVGFNTTSHADAVDLALGAGLRAAIHLGPVAPFAEARIAGWLTGQSVAVGGPEGGTAKVPPFELFLALGVAFGRF